MIIKPYGQERLVSFFGKALSSGSLNHAYIIEGDTGSGKKTLARYFATLAVCENGNACGKCASCREAVADANPDIMWIFPDSKTNLSVDKVREMIEMVSYRSVHGGRRVFIIDNAHLMTVQAQNALLKVIEEPPKNVMFFLLCKQRSKMIATITSRTQSLKLMPLSNEDLLKIAPECNDFQLTYANGNPGKLLKICGDNGFDNLRNVIVQLICKMFADGDEYMYELADFFEQNKELKDDLFTIMVYLLRDVMYKKIGLDRFIVNSDKPDIINKISENLTAASCIGAIEAVLEAERSVGKYVNYNLAIQNMLIKCKAKDTK